MAAAYAHLHDLGHAHSVETWAGDELVGGIYGVAVGGMFFGESMFATATDASKVAMVRLARHLAGLGMPLIDCQVPSAHLLRLGSRLLPRTEFLAHVERLAGQPARLARWRSDRDGTAALA